ncbi:MAG: ribosome biogenesis GTPase Der [Candidatus Omnitrophica bacterium]|nr:ribosome biogenesis GTPase Der [Candidatus Omnitrophota bacterium]
MPEADINSQATRRVRSFHPTVTLVGRPNVGKSTLFNRLSGSRVAIVHSASGTTRDLVRKTVSWKGRKFELCDSGGVLLGAGDDLQRAVEKQVLQAIRESDLIVWVLDVNEGILPVDFELAAKIRQSAKTVIVTPNKADHPSVQQGLDFYSLGFKDVVPVSANQGHGSGELLDRIVSYLPAGEQADLKPALTIALVGEPNSGKSTYLNALLREERSIVSEIPGTTRDALIEYMRWEDELIAVVDTAGLRSRNKIKEPVGFFSLSRTREAIQKADVVLLLFDASAGVTKMTKDVFRLIWDSGKGCVLVANKWDLVTLSRQEFRKRLIHAAAFWEGMRLETLSALLGKGLDQPIRAAREIADRAKIKFPTKQLNEFLTRVTRRNAPPPTVKFKYFVQVGVQPPSFLLFVKNRRRLPDNYILYFRNRLIEELQLEGLPVNVSIKEEARKD